MKRVGFVFKVKQDRIEEYKVRFRNIESDGRREFNPGWHLAMDMRNMLLVSECVAKSGLTRTESRGGHTRDDYPNMDPEWRRALVVCRTSGNDPVMPEVVATREIQPPMREDLLEVLEVEELGKYFTDDEIAHHPGRKG